VTKGRLETFSDGVIAILITIMVLELHAPAGSRLSDLKPLVPTLLAYLLSFVFLGIYWNNHHHLLHLVERINGAVMWANMHLLFWLSLTPFVTAWLGQNATEPVPVATYGVVLLGAAIAYFILTRALLALHGSLSRLAIALGKDWKGKLSAIAYAAAIALAPLSTWLSIAIYIGVAVVWLVPDRRISRVVESRG
jgi:uncharacterized membrane protein